jgi:hypothetical protein
MVSGADDFADNATTQIPPYFSATGDGNIL